MIRAFYGFNAVNPLHLIWLKRKIANRDRYERRSRRPPAEHNFSGLPRHLQSRKPPFSYWWSKPIAMRRDALTGLPEMKSRLAWWNEAHREHQKEAGK